MKRRFRTTLTLAALLSAGAAQAASIGVGAFGGVSIPIVNDLATQGTQFGARVPVGVLPFLTLEPYFASSGLGDVEEDFGTGTTYTRDGGDITAFGLNARLFGASAGMVRFYPFLGLGSNTLAREGSEDVTEVGYQGGIGLGVSPIPRFWIDVRGEFNAIVTGETSQKFGNVTLGVTYDLISLP